MKIKNRMKGIALAAALVLGVSQIGAVGIAENTFAYDEQYFSASSKYTTDDGFVIAKDIDGDLAVVGYEGEGGSVTIPDGVSYIAEKAFYANNNITALTIPESCSNSIDDKAFYSCRKLKYVRILGDIETIGEYAFSCCLSLEKIAFGGDICESTHIGRYNGGGISAKAFAYCKNLKQVIFADENAKIGYIGEDAFKNCYNLEYINLPKGTKLINGSFINCASLENVVIPENTKLENAAFGYMYSDKSDNKSKLYTRADGITETPVSYAKLSSSKMRIQNIVGKKITLVVKQGSYAEEYAVKNGIRYSCVAAPSNIKKSRAKTKIKLSWNSVSGASSYKVYMFDEEEDDYILLDEVSGTTYTAMGLTEGTEYIFRIMSVDSKNLDGKTGGMTKPIAVETKE